MEHGFVLQYMSMMRAKKGEDLDKNLRLKSVVPFQLAYAVSIHKAQGLEYDSVKVIIPSNNAGENNPWYLLYSNYSSQKQT